MVQGESAAEGWLPQRSLRRGRIRPRPGPVDRLAIRALATGLEQLAEAMKAKTMKTRLDATLGQRHPLRRMLARQARGIGAAWALAGLLLAVPASALELDARLKAFATLSALPQHDVQRSQSGATAWDGSADLRLMLRQRTGPLELIVDYSAIFLAGIRSAF